MNKEEFELLYAQRSGTTVEWLHKYGRHGIPCTCGEDCCEGWQMSYLLEDNPHLEDSTYLKELKDMSPHEFEKLYMGNWDIDDKEITETINA